MGGPPLKNYMACINSRLCLWAQLYLGGSLWFRRFNKDVSMDPITISTIASASVSLIIPYLKSFGEGLAKKIGEEVGSESGKAAWSKTKHLYETVKAKLSAKPDMAKAITSLEKSPDDSDTQAALRFQLKDIMSTDEGFARELANILKEASELGTDTMFNTTILGDVQNLIQMGNVFGDVKI
jgi:hypothetical protein